MALRYPDRPIDLAVALGADPADHDDHDADELVVSCIVDGHEDRNPSLVLGVATQVPGRRLFVHCRVCDGSRVAATLERLEIDLGKPPAGIRLWRHDDNGSGDNEAVAGDDRGENDGEGDEGNDRQDAEQKRKAEEDRQKTQAQLNAVHAIWAGGTPFRRGDEAWQYLTRHRGLPDGGPWESALVSGDTVRVARDVSFASRDDDRQLTFALAMLARITTATGRTIGYQLSPLDAERLTLVKPRLTIGSLKGGAVRMAAGGVEDRAALVLAEGLETGLSRLVVGDRVELRVCCGGIGETGQELAIGWAKARLAEPDLPSPAWAWSRVELLLDRDKEGNGRELARALNGTGLVEVRQVKADGQSTRNADLNDVLQGGGVEGVRAAVDGAERMARGHTLLIDRKNAAAAARDMVRWSWFDENGCPDVVIGAQNSYGWHEDAALWKELVDGELHRRTIDTALRSVCLKKRKVELFSEVSLSLARMMTQTAIDYARLAGFVGSRGRVHQLVVDPKTRRIDVQETGGYLPIRGRKLMRMDIPAIVESYGPDTFLTSIIDVDHRDILKDKAPTIFERVLREAFAANPDWSAEDVEAEVKRTYECIGNALDADRLGLQKIIAVLGEGGTGKSLLQRLLLALIGKDAVGTATTDAIEDEKWLLASLVDAKTIMVPDIRSIESAHKKTRDKFIGFLLRTSGQDMVPIAKIYRGVTQATLTSSIWLFANSWPTSIVDSYNALPRRLEFLNFERDPNVRDADAEDTDLEKAVIAGELGAILRRSLAGLDRLYDVKKFTSSTQLKERRKEKLRVVVPMEKFADFFVANEKGVLLRTDLHRAYKAFCTEEGRHARGWDDFISEFKAVLKRRTIPVRERKLQGERQIVGISFAPDVPAEIRRGPLSSSFD